MKTVIGLVHSGDSIGFEGDGYFYQALGVTNVPDASLDDATIQSVISSSTYLSTTPSQNVIAMNQAFPGTRLAGAYPNLVGLAPLYIDPLIPIGYGAPPFDSLRKYLFTCSIGSNDGGVGAYSPSGYTQYAAAVAAACVARKTAGYALIAMCTLLPRNDGAMTQANWTGYNSTITGAGWAAANGIDYIIDLNSQAQMGVWANAGDTTYYSDGIHPTVYGAGLLAPIYLAGINAMIALL